MGRGSDSCEYLHRTGSELHCPSPHGNTSQPSSRRSKGRTAQTRGTPQGRRLTRGDTGGWGDATAVEPPAEHYRGCRGETREFAVAMASTSSKTQQGQLLVRTAFVAGTATPPYATYFVKRMVACCITHTHTHTHRRDLSISIPLYVFFHLNIWLFPSN